MMNWVKNILKNVRRSAISKNSEFREGRLAFANGVRRDENPYAESSQAASSWDAGWLEAENGRRKYLLSQGLMIDDSNFDDFDAHPFWHIVFFIGLIVIFFPWSLLLLLFLFGWDGSVQIFRGLVVGTVGIIIFLLWLAIWILIVIVGVIGLTALIAKA
jgi:ribosome modulation factor